ncbi:receptor-type tyrosine-protein phosphatase H-like [Anableps anableps]
MSFEPVTQTETSITLRWTKVGDIDSYTLSYNGSGISEKEVNIAHSEGGGTHTVSGLSSATRYSFTLFTVFDYARSSGTTIAAVTGEMFTPPDTESFEHVTQTETSITLRWTKVGDIDSYTLSYNGEDVNIAHSEGGGTHTVSGLSSATRYSFTLFTVFEGVRSSGTTITAVTAPPDTESFEPVTQTETGITLRWTKVGDIDSYTLSYNGSGISEKEVNITHSEGGGTHTVSGLSSATRYSFTLFTVFDYARSSGTTIAAVTAPPDTESFEHVTQTETSITLRWTKVGDIDSYTLSYNGEDVNIAHSEGGGTHTVSGLSSATRYSFTLFTVFDYARSSGTTITAVTVHIGSPPDTESFEPVTQTETSITLRWTKVGDIDSYTLSYNGEEVNITHSERGGTHTVSGLSSGTRYSFTLFTVFEGVRSSGTTITAVTVPPAVPSVNVTERFVDGAILQWEDPKKGWEYELDVDANEERSLHWCHKIGCDSVSWDVTNSSIRGTVEGLFSHATASNGSATLDSPEGKTVIFSGLYPGGTYNISLEYNLSSTILPQCSINIPIIPPSLIAHCSYWASGYGALIRWNTPDGVWTGGEVNMNGKTLLFDATQNELTVTGLQPAKKYQVSVISKLKSEFGNRRSEPSVFICSTDNRGVIAGSVFGVLLFGALVCVAAFIALRRPDFIRKVPFISRSKATDTNEKTVSAAKFPDHFHQLSLDENRGFSQEYEDLAPVGTGQTCKAAILPENRQKNRFNILPYDCCRVKLNTSTPSETDYINASYIPGYNYREYIATQGPLPSTVNDFWRVIWEQKVRRVVMVTNCIEAGRTKCEQYWPENQKQSQYGEMLVTGTSELKEPNWTLREFRVKHKKSSEERTVRHFHFTVWPDRGVPQGTEVLIRFRGIVRRHIESDGSEAPTVVHCSDGVGRTGTFIALDVLLQQLEKEQAVGIKDFLHRMRQHRSHMVQTESQYVFLHQCIMDSLQPHATQEEHIYENDDLLYANTIRLEEFT